MAGSRTETLTAALRRLADERADGLLSIATPGRDVVLELREGAPAAIGPVFDTTGTVGGEAPEGVRSAAIVDELVWRAVEAIVGGGGSWTWDVASDAELVPVPPGLAAELSRRAVDAAQALAGLGDDAVLSRAWELEVTGQVGRLHQLLDGQRTLEELAAELRAPLPAVATWADALTAAGAAGVEGVEEPEEAASWMDTVAGRAARDEDDGDDDETHVDGDDSDAEPELWVMTPPDPEPEPERAPGPESDDATTPEPEAWPPEAPAATPGEPPATPAGSDPAASDAGPTDAETGDASAAERRPSSGPDTSEPQPSDGAPAAASLVEEEDDWADTAWLDDLDDDEPGHRRAPLFDEEDDDLSGGRAALSSMLQELDQSDSPSAEPPPTEREDSSAEPRSTPDRDESDRADDEGGSDIPDPRRKDPKAEPGQVAEFLRELSRLALDED